MIHRLYTASLFCVALTAVSFATGTSKALAEITYPFEATYDTTSIPIVLEQTNQGIVVRVDSNAQSDNAPYGLTKFEGFNYARIESDKADVISSDPAPFGLEGQPLGIQNFFGEGEDKIFGTFEGSATSTGTVGTVTITGGEGRFSDATGSLNLTQVIESAPGGGQPIIALTTVQGSFEVVPEPDSVLGTLAFSIGAAGLLLKPRINSKKAAIKL